MVKKKKKASKKPIRKKSARKVKKKKAEQFQVAFEEVTVACSNCRRKFIIVKSSGFGTEGMLCQRCSAGGGVGIEEQDDI